MLRCRSLLLLVAASTAVAVDQRCTAFSTPEKSTFFPPPELKTDAEIGAWFAANTPSIAAKPDMSTAEKTYIAWSAADFMAQRKSGAVTCEAYVSALVKRAEHYKDMNQFMYFDNDAAWTARVISKAAELDAKVASAGGDVSVIAPLYCLPVAMKGTVATVGFKSSCGMGMLHDFSASENATIVDLIESKGGVVFGKTNVPEFAASLVTCNYATGCTVNPHDATLSAGGSSGGSGSAVAAHVAPIAITEDTGGSTRAPAFSNGNFGYDPTRGHYPNGGNPGMSLILDQIGTNARTMADIIAFDEQLMGWSKAAAYPTPKALRSLRVGLPIYPFVEAYVPEGGHNPFGYAQFPSAFKPSAQILDKYEAAKAALKAAGAQLVSAEWPADEGGVNVLAKAWFLTLFNGKPLSMHFDVFLTYMGQVSQWVNDYLGVLVSIDDIMADSHAAGAHHAPANFMALSKLGDERKLQFINQELRAAGVRAWNRLFDEHSLDVILVPGFLHTPSYECGAAGTCTHQVKNLTTGETTSQASFTALHNLFMHTLSMKVRARRTQSPARPATLLPCCGLPSLRAS